MEFRPCIDIHNGQVKQIVGGSLQDKGDQATENFVACQDASFFAALYRNHGIRGGHVILLNPIASPYYDVTKKQALSALSAYPGGLQVGGGITPENAKEFLDAGASHVIVTSYVFKDGVIHFDRLENLRKAVGAGSLVLDVSCRKVNGQYRVVTDRWQKVTDQIMDMALLDELSGYCDEFLIHAVDVEGKSNGIETNLVSSLGGWQGNPITYAGGVHSYEDIGLLKELSKGRMNVTVGSALDLFGGSLSWRKIQEMCNQEMCK